VGAPLLVGASLRLLGRGRQAQLGLALAGFALLFAGIHALQQAMAGQGLLQKRFAVKDLLLAVRSALESV
jgi:hypothetical protein